VEAYHIFVIYTVLSDSLSANFTPRVGLSVMTTERRMRWSEYVALEKFENGYMIVVGKSETKKPQSVDICRCGNYIVGGK
jgi:hypothetical protein